LELRIGGDHPLTDGSIADFRERLGVVVSRHRFALRVQDGSEPDELGTFITASGEWHAGDEFSDSKRRHWRILRIIRFDYVPRARSKRRSSSSASDAAARAPFAGAQLGIAGACLRAVTRASPPAADG